MYTQLAVIQPTSYCNINCQYCYLPERNLSKRIHQKTLEQIFKMLFSSPFVANKITISWHAGEPLILPIGFYEHAFQLQEAWNIKHVQVINTIQTNATLITHKWCRFFQEHNIRVGISLDGPQDLHNAKRIDRLGHGTFEKTLRGVELLRTYHIPYTVISVITNVSLNQADEFWQFFSQLEPTNIGLNPEEIEGINTSSSLFTETDFQKYKQFLKRLLQLNEQSQHPLPIRELENFMHIIRASKSPTFAQTNVPLSIISFDCEGNFSTFSPELLTVTHPVYGNFHFGNVYQNKLEDILTHPKFQSIRAEIQAGIKHCEVSCPYFALCGGGSPSNKLHENDTFSSTETFACRMQIKAPVDALLEYLEAHFDLSSIDELH